MPEETVKYKIEIDDTDLARKLADVRDRINTSLASPISNFTTPTEPLAFEATLQQNNLVNRLGEAFSQIDTSQLGAVKDQLSQFSEGARLAAQRASQDIGELMRTVPSIPISRYPSGAPNAYNQILHNINNQGFFGTARNSAIGFDWDSQMPLSIREYQHEARAALFRPDRVGSLSAGAAEIGVSTAVMGLSGPLGFATGAYLHYGAGREKQRDELALTIRGMSRSFKSGEFDWHESLTAAGGLQELERSPDLRLKGIDQDEIQGTILDFANLGGFEKTQDVDQFLKTSRDLMSNVKEVMHALRITRQEAVEVMREVQQFGVSDLGDAGELAFSVGGLGKTFRRDPNELMSFAMEGAKQLFTTAGVAPGTGFDLMMRSRIEAEAMRSTPMGEISVAALGGPGAAAQQMMATTMEFYQSPLGIRTLKAMQAGADPTAFGIMDANYGMTPLEYMGRMFTAPSDAAEFSTREMLVNQINPVLEVLNEQSMGEGVTDAQLAGTLMQRYGWDRNTAAANVALFRTDPQIIAEKEMTGYFQGKSQEAMEEPTIGQRFKARMGEIKDNFTGAFTDPANAIYRGASNFVTRELGINQRNWESFSQGLTSREESEIYADQTNRDASLSFLTGENVGRTRAEREEIEQRVSNLRGLLGADFLDGGDMIVEQRRGRSTFEKLGIQVWPGPAPIITTNPVLGRALTPYDTKIYSGDDAKRLISKIESFDRMEQQAEEVKVNELSLDTVNQAKGFISFSKDSTFEENMEQIDTLTGRKSVYTFMDVEGPISKEAEKELQTKESKLLAGLKEFHPEQFQILEESRNELIARRDLSDDKELMKSQKERLGKIVKDKHLIQVLSDRDMVKKEFDEAVRSGASTNRIAELAKNLNSINSRLAEESPFQWGSADKTLEDVANTYIELEDTEKSVAQAEAATPGLLDKGKAFAFKLAVKAGLKTGAEPLDADFTYEDFVSDKKIEQHRRAEKMMKSDDSLTRVQGELMKESLEDSSNVIRIDPHQLADIFNEIQTKLLK